MEILGLLAFVLLVTLLIVWPLTLGRRYLRGRRDRNFEQRAREVWMGAPQPWGLGGYVPHGDLGPSVRDRLSAPPDDEHA